MYVKSENEWRQGTIYNGAAAEAKGDIVRGRERGAAGREGKGTGWRGQADTGGSQSEGITE